jgi:hypothetical protein
MKDIDLKASLKKYFGFSTFIGLQEDVIKNILGHRNTFVIMPTGGGKSLCYQLPALIEDGTAIVVSPLIALMKNQVDAIRGVSDNHGTAHVLNSSLTKNEVRQVKEDITNGITKLLYVAPESLTKQEYVEFLQGVNLSFVAIVSRNGATISVRNTETCGRSSTALEMTSLLLPLRLRPPRRYRRTSLKTWESRMPGYLRLPLTGPTSFTRYVRRPRRWMPTSFGS